MYLALVLVATLLLGRETRTQSPASPNILFIILDDVGKDQLASFNPDATTGLLTPNLNALAAGGVKFTNFMTMPECSPSRVAFFTGRYPLRTGVDLAILDLDLPAAQISPFEVTTPKVLAAAGYTSAMFGKYHLGGPENNPDGDRAPIALGWNHFDGTLVAYPPSLDVSIGGQYTKDTAKYSCGFPTGPERGACWFQRPGNQVRCDDNGGAGYTGQQGVAMGGIPALDAQGNLAPTCSQAVGSGPDFSRTNAYYVWPQIVADANGHQVSQSRQYMTTAQTDAAIAWIRRQSQASERRPWMATVTYNAIHTPYQLPPPDLYPPGFVWPANVPQNCTDPAAKRVVSALMLAALDREIGRLLVSVGLAWQDGPLLVYRPEFNDTMVVIAGDNGSYYPIVQSPYNPLGAKGTAYQTGVSTPLMVSGPLVAGKGRSVDHLVNAVDLFQLFSEIPRDPVDLSVVVPPSHVLDSQRMLAYLRDPDQPALRRFNFTQIGPGVKATSTKMWPCVLNLGPIHTVSDFLFTSQSVCEINGGAWFGPTAERPVPQFATSCEVRAAGIYNLLVIQPTRVWAIRDRQYKLVQVERAPCDSSMGEYELYDLTPKPPLNPLGLDVSTANLLTNGQPVGLTSAQMTAFVDLKGQLSTLRSSERVCDGDGNLDKRVDFLDLDGVRRYMGLPSVFDFSRDGVTGSEDFEYVARRLGTDCR